MGVPLTVGVELAGDGLGHVDVGVAGIAGLAGALEAAGVSYWVIGAERGERNDITREGLEPSLLATIAARHTSRLGLVVAAAAHRDHPYNLARRLVSVDHAAHGRVGWLALDFDHRTALNASSDTWTGADLDAAHTDDAIAAVRTLWRTWPLDSVVGDLDTGVFSDVSRIRRADVHNMYDIAGPLNVPGSVQGDLPVWRQAGFGRGGLTGDPDYLIVEDGEPIPLGAEVVVRLRSADSIDAALERIAGYRGVSGVLLRIDPSDVGHVLHEMLPLARERKLLSQRRTGTLREQLGVPVPAAPDLTGNPTAFETVPNPGGRL
ncbi:luciferase [Mycolicibacterium conceptionense]|uniref:Luciferase n=1 Tax=Mycolicibacterium conceptionense TaxID=451644 RepID=A0A1A0PHT1_9MYCO|nr:MULTISPECIES: LLM class flavin-dependent oxidoreductase [Mycolicibacterium]MCW1820532.1 LLM class flavin-dependent oxidoreductase [Mycolicibacterium senegalense]OBB09293.1 luciferase [Mycolicibacterium conceptionense]OBF05937.1 luciferase [Mycolicibacterium conceptionense]OBF27219.1 luciferase [Mycolicibacterium conceptionense]OBF46601.1 luciferase [Mycolicibacterium conceptionense]